MEELPAPNLWDQICAEFEAMQPPHPDTLDQKREVPLEPKQEPVVTSQEAPVGAETSPDLSGDLSKSPLTDESVAAKTPSFLSLPTSPELPDLKTCTPRELLECYIFPVLLPGMAELLHQAKKEKCFERKRTRFIALDFLTEWLYNHNPKRKDEPFVEFFEIPFVKEWLKDHPRPPIPLSLLLTEEEAGNIIQSFWRGYRVRCEPEVQELRQWQKHLRETKNIIKRVREFWAKQEKKVGTKLEDSAQPSPVRSKQAVVEILPVPEVTTVTEKVEDNQTLPVLTDENPQMGQTSWASTRDLAPQ
ncbi:IQ domain-containing protein K isoform X1 [Zootoca vivipara]|uniref:IQ domain-containing protein K isoform X1 n=1 Tax=Zootoca vivipara TaxID=8524 RepID=UPI00159240C9|nr:IQ domain-containing protein K isoform X1 [Zootoca vivipara]